MKGHVRKRSGRYYVMIERGRKAAQQCVARPTPACRRLHWLDRDERLEACPACGGALADIRARRQDQLPGGFKRRRDADAALRDALGRVQSGTWVPPTRQTVTEYLVEWIDGAEARVRPATVALYRIVERAYIRPALGELRLADLTAARLEAFYARLLKSGGKNGRGISAATVRHAHSLLRKALGDAVRKDLLSRNVAAVASRPRVERPPMRTWTADQLRVFLEHARDDRLHAAWVVAATTGMRRGEILGLRWSALDLDRLAIAVTSELLVEKGGPRLVDLTKTASSRRSVSLDNGTATALRAHRARQAQERLVLGRDYHDLDLVFADEMGEPLRPTTFSRRFAAIAREAELPSIRLHDLRHTFATLALSAGVHPKVVQERLGHSSVTLTLDTYSHVIPTMQENAANVVAGLILGSS